MIKTSYATSETFTAEFYHGAVTGASNSVTASTISSLTASATATIDQDIENATLSDSSGVTSTTSSDATTFTAGKVEYLVFGTTSADTINMSSAGGYSEIFGGDGNDVLRGSTSHDNDIWGGAGNDHLYGGDSGDNASGTSTADTDYIKAGTGDDFIYGNRGGDSLYGESGSDYFVYSSPHDGAYWGADSKYDYIGDFSSGDKIGITGTLSSYLDDINVGDGGLTFANLATSPGGVDFNSTHEALFVNSTVSGISDSAVWSVSSLVSALSSQTFYSSAGADALILVAGNTDSAIYYYYESSGDNSISSSELMKLAVVDNYLLSSSDGALI